MADFQSHAHMPVATGASFTRYDAAVYLEELADDVSQLSALVQLAATGEDIPENIRQALRCVASRLDDIGETANYRSEAFLSASRAAKSDVN